MGVGAVFIVLVLVSFLRFAIIESCSLLYILHDRPYCRVAVSVL